ncbi:aconitate hydratase [Candidatus Micrarchaeota archaeon]|nr:aconitate hydratase [Candidatus Micrarchaeota archaeon]
MVATLVEKILKAHLVDGELTPGTEIGLRIDQTLTQDATGTMAYLQFETIGIPRVKTELSVSYVDHNMLQTGFENMDDHRFLQSVASKYGIYFSKAGNGICHQVHLERFAAPGKTLLGSDSHTPTAGGMGMLAIGAGGLDIAVAMGGSPFFLKVPKVLGVKLLGKLSPWVSAKDVILEVLRRLKVKGGVGKVLEYYGEGVTTLSVPERSTITNMGAELGATSSIFPSDEMTRDYLKKQGRETVWRALSADEGAVYDETLEIDLSHVEPLVAQPSSPDNVVPISQVEGKKVQQVIIGSCTNSSYKDLMVAAEMVKGKKVHPDVSFVVAPGSRQVLEQITKAGGLTYLIAAGARLIESACGPCIGMGLAPASNTITVRTFNRNFKGRSGTKDDQSYLVGPEVAVACALAGEFKDPRKLGELPRVEWPERFDVDDSMILRPATDGSAVEILRGPNIKEVPIRGPMDQTISGDILLKLSDNITTDGIMPAGAKILPLRSNIPAISEFVFCNIDPTFVQRIKEKKGGLIVGGENYGQGSSREHAALAPMYLGVRAVITKNFARIHKGNLVNFGILPLEFKDAEDYHRVNQGDVLEIPDARTQLENGKTEYVCLNITQNRSFPVVLTVSKRQQGILLAGGLLNQVKQSGD